MRRLDEHLTPDFGYFVDATLIAETHSPYQHVQIFDSPTFGRLLRLDGALQCSVADEFFYHEALVHLPMALTRAPERVLIVGGGDGGAAEEALKWPTLRRLDHVEIDTAVVELCRDHLAAIHRGVLEGVDPRYHLHVADGAAWLREQQATYDVILLDLTDCGGPSENLYATGFYAACHAALAEQGALALHIGASWSQPSVLQENFARLTAVFQCVQPYCIQVPLYGGQWTLALCRKTLSTGEEAPSSLAALAGPPLRALDDTLLRHLRHLPPYLRQTLFPS